MKEKEQTVNESDLMREVSELHRQLNEAQLKIEGYEIIGDILEEQYGTDLLKKTSQAVTRLWERYTEVSLQTLCALFGYTRQSVYLFWKRQGLK